MPTPVKSADTHARVFPSASFDHGQSFASPNVFAAASFSPTAAPSRFVTRCTVDSLRCRPHNSGSVYSAASAKLPNAPANADTQAAPGLRSHEPSPNCASRGKQPRRHFEQ